MAHCSEDILVYSDSMLKCGAKNGNSWWYIPSYALFKVAGDLYVTNFYSSSGFTQVDIPYLSEVGGDVYFYNVHRVVTTISLPMLHNVTGQVFFQYVDATTIELPSLTHVGGSLTYRDTDDSTGHVANASFPSLLSVGSNVYFYYNIYLDGLHMPRLHSVGGYLNLDYMYYLRNLNLRSLETVGDYISFGRLQTWCSWCTRGRYLYPRAATLCSVRNSASCVIPFPQLRGVQEPALSRELDFILSSISAIRPPPVPIAYKFRFRVLCVSMHFPARAGRSAGVASICLSALVSPDHVLS